MPLHERKRPESVQPWQRIGLIVLIFLCFFGNIGRLPLFDEDEGAYAEVTREMIASGDYITPKLNGTPFFHKPPAIYWLQACSIYIFGKNEFALRFPSAVAAVFWVMVLFRFIRKHVGEAEAWYGAVFLISGLQTALIAKAAIPDALLNLFLTLTCLHIYDYYRSGRKRHVYASYVFMALGVLTKGPIAIIIPLVVSGVFFFYMKKQKDWLRAIVHPGGWSLFLCVALPWYLLLYHTHGQAFIDDIFFTHNINRFRTAFEGHSGSLFFYLPVVVLGMMPHTAFLLKTTVLLKKLWGSPINRFCIFWFGFVLIFFSLAGTKLHHYIVYGYSPLLLLMAQNVRYVRHRWALSFWPMVFIIVSALLPIIVTSAVARTQDDVARYVLMGFDQNPKWGLSGAAVFAFALILGSLLWKKLSLPHLVFLNAAVFTALINFWILPIAGDVMQSPIKEAAIFAKKRQLDVIMWQMSYPSFFFYNERIIPERMPSVGDIVITKITKLNKIHRHRILYEKNGIVMTQILAIKP